MHEERERMIRLAFAALCIAASIALVMAAVQNSGAVEEVFRLNARQLQDGRVEIAVEHWNGSQWNRHSPSSRYLSADQTVGDWFRSEMFSVAVPMLEYLADQPMATSEPESHQTNELSPPISHLGPPLDCQMDSFDLITPGQSKG
jgi:opacity protein-like surface antigen